MQTLKKGSKGDDVIALQHLLNVEGYKLTIDGDFGAKTETAVKMYQKAHGLEDDGIVGDKTWTALGVKSATPTSTNSKCVDPSVVYAPLTCCITRAPNRTIKYLAIHYTAGASSASGRAKGMKSSWRRADEQALILGLMIQRWYNSIPTRKIINVGVWATARIPMAVEAGYTA